jgi:hypothetical protein
LQNGKLIALKLVPRRRRFNQATPRYASCVLPLNQFPSHRWRPSVRAIAYQHPVTARLGFARGSLVFSFVDFYDL